MAVSAKTTRHKTTTDFAAVMAAEHARSLMTLVTARHPTLKLPSCREYAVRFGEGFISRVAGHSLGSLALDWDLTALEP